MANGGFEVPFFYSDFTTYGPDEDLGGWTVEFSSVDLIGTRWAAAQGQQSIDLSGNQPGGLHQDLATAAGQAYHLSFAMAGNPEYESVKTMEVWWGNQKVDTLSFDTTGRNATDMGWLYHSYTVVGSGNDQLRFVSLGGPAWFGPALDDVSVTPVPEPASLALLALGIGGWHARRMTRAALGRAACKSIFP